MRLRQLLGRGVSVEGSADNDPEINALTADSRTVENGALFAAFAGARTDGRRYVDQAIAKGAVAILGDPSLKGRDLGVPLIVDSEPRRRFALIAGRFFERQPAHAVAVTGTNGKTSVATFTRQLFEAQGLRAASLGTLGMEAPGFPKRASLTTPDPVQLHKLLAELADADIQHLALEASSHGLDQHRLDGVVLKAAAFTNLSRDHFDYHGGMEAYFAAKARLFEDLLPADGKAILNADIPEFDRLNAICRARGQEVISFGVQARDIRLLERHPRNNGQDLFLDIRGRSHRLETALMGDFQAANLMAALALAWSVLGDEALDDLVGALATISGAPGRLQRIDGSPGGVSVFVDYAHTPDALAHVLDALRPHAEGALMVVFGAGGDRDPGKRALMGKIASERADKVFITDDNPRSEDPALIRRAILDACPGGIDAGERAQAIHLAVRKLGVGDILVVAGKGHETGQIVGEATLPFDDVAVVKAALNELTGSGTHNSAPLLHGKEQ